MNTITLQNTSNWLAAFIVQRPQAGVGGTVFEPFLTSANKVMCAIMAAPLRWEWNRTYAAAAITTVAGTTDYAVSLPTFGYLEKGTVNYVVVPPNTNPNYELQVIKNISRDTKQNRPQFIGVLLDDNSGNITFRLFPAPDQVYTVDLIYQRAPIQATNLTGTWAPIPDKLQPLYEQGVLSHLQMMYNQQLALSNLEVFYRSLISVSEGLTEMEKAIWLEDQLRTVRAQQETVLGVQQGKASRQ